MKPSFYLRTVVGFAAIAVLVGADSLRAQDGISLDGVSVASEFAAATNLTAAFSAPLFTDSELVGSESILTPSSYDSSSLFAGGESSPAANAVVSVPTGTSGEAFFPVPEPGTIALAGLGSLCLLRLGRKSHKAV